MTSQEILEFITGIGIVPIVRVSSAESAVQAVEAIYQGGVRAAEITMTVPGAIRALEKVADLLGDKMMLGAGTVLDPETARACMLAGAQFFVTPALRVSTIEMAKRYSKVIFPGRSPYRSADSLGGRRRCSQDFSLRERRRAQVYQGA